jgi:hypothetical protein
MLAQCPHNESATLHNTLQSALSSVQPEKPANQPETKTTIIVLQQNAARRPKNWPKNQHQKPTNQNETLQHLQNNRSPPNHFDISKQPNHQKQGPDIVILLQIRLKAFIHEPKLIGCHINTHDH